MMASLYQSESCDANEILEYLIANQHSTGRGHYVCNFSPCVTQHTPCPQHHKRWFLRCIRSLVFQQLGLGGPIAILSNARATRAKGEFICRWQSHSWQL